MLSENKDDEYTVLWKPFYKTTLGVTWSTDVFLGTGGKFTNDPVVGTNYYIKPTSTITLDANGGTSGISSIGATYGFDMLSIALPEKSDCDFVGYFDAETGGNQYYSKIGKSVKSGIRLIKQQLCMHIGNPQQLNLKNKILIDSLTLLIPLEEQMLNNSVTSILFFYFTFVL